MKLDLKPSSHIAGAEYDPASMELAVSYANGGRYIYEGVPSEVATAFVAADSHGGFHNRHLKGRYKGRRG